MKIVPSPFQQGEGRALVSAKQSWNQAARWLALIGGVVNPIVFVLTYTSAVIDFGCCAVGDPACDTVIAWTYFSGESRELFKRRLPVDRAAWARGRGWALWKAMIVLVEALREDPEDAIATKRVIAGVLSDYART